MVNTMQDQLQVTEKISKHDADIKNLFKMVSTMDTKIDRIDEKIDKMNNELHTYINGVDREVYNINLELHENCYELDRRVTALESKNETLKWCLGASVVVLTFLQFFLTYII